MNNPTSPSPQDFQLPQPVGQTPAAPGPTQGANPGPALSTAPAASEAPQQAAPQAPPAQDGDIIEPIWVQRVDQVLRETAQDPHELAWQLMRIRSEYMQRRYGFTLKQPLEDDQA